MTANNKNKYDLEERTSKFGSDTIKYLKKIPKNAITVHVISQLVRAATSVGANYCEADNAESRADFKHKIGICRKESKECIHWFNMLIVAEESLREVTEPLLKEAKELNLVFNAITISLDKNDKN